MSFMDLDALNRLLDEGDRVSGAYILVESGRWNEFLAALKKTPRAAAVVIKEQMRNSFRRTTAESIGLLQKMYMAFAVLVAFGIVYNSARISLSERQRELATLRVIGFTQREVAAVLVGELAILTLLALPLGLLIGSGFATAVIQTVNTEFVRLPVIFTGANYALATLVVGTAATLSALFASRKLSQLDLVSVLKARD